MDMPAYQLTQIPIAEEMAEAIGFCPLEAWKVRVLAAYLKMKTR